jgi:hypothetical protein
VRIERLIRSVLEVYAFRTGHIQHSHPVAFSEQDIFSIHTLLHFSNRTHLVLVVDCSGEWSGALVSEWGFGELLG